MSDQMQRNHPSSIFLVKYHNPNATFSNSNTNSAVSSMTEDNLSYQPSLASLISRDFIGGYYPNFIPVQRCHSAQQHHPHHHQHHHDMNRPRDRSLFTTRTVHNCFMPIPPFQPVHYNPFNPVNPVGICSFPPFPKEIYRETTLNYWGKLKIVYTMNGVAVTDNGFLTLNLRNDIRIDITLDSAVRILNVKSNIVCAVSASGNSSALLHPNGSIYQYGSHVEILAYDPNRNNKMAKIWSKGVSFTSSHCSLTYLVDSVGTKSVSERSFIDLSLYDASIQVFNNESHTGANMISAAMHAVQNSRYWKEDDMTENWVLNNIKIVQKPDGFVRVAKQSNKFLLHTSPTNGSARITTPFIHCTGSLGPTRHLFVRRGERRMHFDGSSFTVRNGAFSAGFDDSQQLRVY